MSSEEDHDLAQDVPESGGNHEGDEIRDEKGAAVRFPPPLIFVLLIFFAAGLNYLWPLSIGVPEAFEPLGIALTLFGVTVVILINGTYKRVGTAIEPWKPTAKLITTGYYHWSRNPIYVGFCLFNIGIGISADSLWILLSFIPGIVLVYYIAVAKEEAYLEQKFGQEYLDYKARVRRWI